MSGSNDAMSDGSDFDYEEKVNLDDFNFNESMIEWKLQPMPHLPPR